MAKPADDRPLERSRPAAVKGSSKQIARAVRDAFTTLDRLAVQRGNDEIGRS